MEDYKEKYEMALEGIQEILSSGQDSIKMPQLQLRLQGIFPELRGDEDEKIRNRILLSLEKDLMATKNSGCDTQDLKQCIAWLEKQGEQKPIMNVPTREVILSIWDLGNEWKELTNGSISTEYGTQLDYIQKHWYESEYYLREKQGEQKPVLDFKASNWYVSKVDGKIHDLTYNPTNKIEPKFKVGDYIVSDYCMGKVVEITNDAYLLDTEQGIPFSCSNTRLWDVTKDAKDGDVLVGNKGEVILMFRGIGNTEWDDVIDYHCYYDCCHENFVVQKSAEYWGNTENNQLKPATRKQRDTLFAKMKEAGYQWDADKKELKLLITNGGDFEQKQEWSEEDENYLQSAENACEYQYGKNTSTILWLKSLKDRIGE